MWKPQRQTLKPLEIQEPRESKNAPVVIAPTPSSSGTYKVTLTDKIKEIGIIHSNHIDDVAFARTLERWLPVERITNINQLYEEDYDYVLVVASPDTMYECQKLFSFVTLLNREMILILWRPTTLDLSLQATMMPNGDVHSSPITFFPTTGEFIKAKKNYELTIGLITAQLGSWINHGGVAVGKQIAIKYY